jgi:hypothetical protein
MPLGDVQVRCYGRLIAPYRSGYPVGPGWPGPTAPGSNLSRKLSRTLKNHFHGILAYLETRQRPAPYLGTTIFPD